MPVTADDAVLEPEVSLTADGSDVVPVDQNSDDAGTDDGIEGPPVEGDPAPDTGEPVEPVSIAVVPLPPVITEASCGEGVVYAQVASAPVVDGVTYEIGTPDAEGTFTVTAYLADPAVYMWANSGLDGWTVSGNQAEMTGTVSLCSVEDAPADVAEDPVPEDAKNDDAGVPVGNGLIYIDPAQTVRTSSQVGTASTDATLNYSVSPTTPVGPGALVAFSSSIHTTANNYNVGITNTLPAGVTFSHVVVESKAAGGDLETNTSDVYSCAFEAGIVTCHLRPNVHLLAGGTVIWTVYATVDASVIGEDCPSVRRTSVQGNWAGSPAITAELSVECIALLNISATDDVADGESVGLNEPFTYTVNLSNTGTTVSGDFELLSQLPSGVVLAGDSPITHPQGTTCTSGVMGSLTTITCTGTSVSPGQGNDLIFQFTVMAVDIIDGQLNTSACDSAMFVAAGTIGEWNQEARLINVYTDVDCVSGVEYTLAPLETAVEPGGTIGFVQTVQNTGNTHILTLGMFNTPPPELPAGDEWSGSFEIDGVTYESLPSVMALKPGSVFKATYESSPVPTDLTLPAPAWCTEFTFSNEVEFVFSTGERVDDAGSATVRVNCTGLSIEQQVSDDLIEPGSEVTYTITVTNLGNTTVSPLYVFHDSSETGGLFSNWQVTGDNALDCGLVEDVHPGCTYLTLDRDESLEITITGDAPLNPTAEQCEPVTSQAVFVYGESLTSARATANLASPYTPVYSEPVTTQLNCVPSFTFTNMPLESPVVPGEQIGFELTVHNNGTVRLTDVSMDADDLGELPEGDWNMTFELDGVPIDQRDVTGLNAGETLVVTLVSDAIPDDITVPDNEWCKPWSSSFTATAEFIVGPEQTITDSATVEVNCTGLSLDMEVSAPAITPGGKVEYIATVTNHGNTAVAPLVVAMDLEEPSTVFTNWTVSSDYEGLIECELLLNGDASVAVCFFVGLLSGDSATIIVTGDAPVLPTLAQCDVVENQSMFLFGFAEQIPGQPVLRTISAPITPPGVPVVSDFVSTRIDCQPEVGISLDSEIDHGGNNRVDAGDTVTYTMAVTNSGNMALYGIVVTTDLAGIDWDRELVIDELLPDEAVTITGTYSVSQGDIDAGQLEITATVNASLEPVAEAAGVQFPGLLQVTEPMPMLPDSVTSTVTERIELVQEPGIQLEISSASDAELPSVGELIRYTFTVLNTGNVTLTGIEVVPEIDGLVFPNGATLATLAPGEEATVLATYTVTEADVEAGSFVVCADVTATDSGNDPVSDTERCITTIIDQRAPVTPTPSPGVETPTPPTPEVPVTPEPATPVVPEAGADVVTKLPETGNGHAVLMAPVVWAAAIVGIVALGAGAIGIRRRV